MMYTNDRKNIMFCQRLPLQNIPYLMSMLACVCVCVFVRTGYVCDVSFALPAHRQLCLLEKGRKVIHLLRLSDLTS